MKTIIAFALSVVLLASCGNMRSPEADLDKMILDEKTALDKVAANMEETPDGAYADANKDPDLTSDLKVNNPASGISDRFKTPDKIIRTANVRMRVEDYKKARQSVEKIVLAAGGYIAAENEQNNSYSITNELIIRVTGNAFGQLLNELSELGVEVHAKNSSSQDVTAEFVDLQARIKTKKEVEARYTELLKRANTIKDILEIENNIRIIREEIEAREGQLKYLSDQVSYSTIHLSVYQNIEGAPGPDEPGFFEKFAEAFGKGWNGLLGFLLAFISAWPVWLILAGMTWGIVRLVKRLTRKAKPALPVQTPSSQA